MIRARPGWRRYSATTRRRASWCASRSASTASTTTAMPGRSDASIAELFPEDPSFAVSPVRSDPTMSNDGSFVFFQSPVGLTPRALDDVQVGAVEGVPTYAENVYEWHEGHVYLISDGRDASEGPYGKSSVQLLGSDASGANVFFTQRGSARAAGHRYGDGCVRRARVHRERTVRRVQLPPASAVSGRSVPRGAEHGARGARRGDGHVRRPGQSGAGGAIGRAQEACRQEARQA